MTTSTPPATSAIRNWAPCRWGRCGNRVVISDRCARRSEGTAAYACGRRAVPVRCAPQRPQNSPPGTVEPQCEHVTSGGPSSAKPLSAAGAGGDLALAVTRGLRLVLLPLRLGIEHARPAAASALVDRAAPGVLLEVHALAGLENGRAANRGHRRQRRGEARGRVLALPARERSGVAAGDEVRHALRDGPVVDRRVRVAHAVGHVRLARAEAFRAD